MAFGINRSELNEWKSQVEKGEIAFLTHFWMDPRFMNSHAVTKAGCSDVGKLIRWGERYGLKKEWIHDYKNLPHYDLMGELQLRVLKDHGLSSHIERFNLEKKPADH